MTNSTVSLTIEQIRTLPQEELLKAADAELHLTPVGNDEPGYHGLVIQHPADGRLIIAQAEARADEVRDCATRFMIATWYGLDTTGFPAHLLAADYARTGAVMAQSKESLR